MTRLYLLLPLLLLAACAAPVPWQNPHLPKEQWSDDYNRCRAEANRQVGWRDEQASGTFAEYDRAQAKRQYNAYMDMCMRELGYFPAKPRR